ncbi:MAG: acetylglutamate kinase [Candidatus Desulfofervidaceae bacterium]|nr:acetylglutamate kinase [Candidatus Desulfofervidaceae bacterium]
MGDSIKRAEVLIESLPYLREFYKKTFVIKYGGHAMVDEELKRNFALDIVLLKYIGLNPIVVHGGGPQIGEVLKKMNIPSCFVGGLRVTDDATMDVVEMVLVGKVNKEIVNLINQAGGKAVGLSGKDGCLIEARKIVLKQEELPDKPPEIIDLGHVGEVAKVNKEVLDLLDQEQFIPIIAPVGVGRRGETLNINADWVAGEIAAALKAKKLILLTDVPGVLDKEGNLISSMTLEDAENLIKNGVITGGMIPKIQAALKAVRTGVEKAHIIDGRILHAVLLELFTIQGIGTEIVNI